jgi:hypothetical protein
MKQEPDWAKLREISKRLDEAQTQPDYPAAFTQLAAEARNACGDYPETMEFLGPYSPTDDGQAPFPLLWKRFDEQERQQSKHNAPAA